MAKNKKKKITCNMAFNRTNYSQQKNKTEKNYCTLALDVLSGPHFGISPIVVCSSH